MEKDAAGIGWEHSRHRNDVMAGFSGSYAARGTNMHISIRI